MSRKQAILPIVLVLAFARCGGSADLNGEDAANDEGAPDSGDDATTDPADDTPADTPVDVSAEEAPGEDAVHDELPTEDAPGDITADEEIIPDAPGCEDGCTAPLLCCDERCVNPQHDPAHCSRCYIICPSTHPYCNLGECGPRPCSVTCTGITECCGTQCCELGQICCAVDGPGPSIGPGCYDDVCPPGCPWCV